MQSAVSGHRRRNRTGPGAGWHPPGAAHADFGEEFCDFVVQSVINAVRVLMDEVDDLILVDEPPHRSGFITDHQSPSTTDLTSRPCVLGPVSERCSDSREGALPRPATTTRMSWLHLTAPIAPRCARLSMPGTSALTESLLGYGATTTMPLCASQKDGALRADNSGSWALRIGRWKCTLPRRRR